MLIARSCKDGSPARNNISERQCASAVDAMSRGEQGVRMCINQVPRCPRNQLHRVHRLPQLPAQVLKIENQGPPMIRILKTEAPPWWCDQCGLQLDAPARP